MNVCKARREMKTRKKIRARTTVKKMKAPKARKKKMAYRHIRR